MKRILTLLFAAMLILTACGGGGGGVSIESGEQAEAFLREAFPEPDYIVDFAAEVALAEDMFEVEVGEYCGDYWTKAAIPVYSCAVFCAVDGSMCTCMVAQDGRIVAYGSMVNPLDESGFYRIN